MNDTAPTIKPTPTRRKRARGIELRFGHDMILDACREYAQRMFPGHLVTIVPSGLLDVVTAMIVKPRERNAKETT